MSTDEKIYIRKLLAKYYYQGQIDESIEKICHMVGWVPFEAGGYMPEEQQCEIEYYLTQGRR